MKTVFHSSLIAWALTGLLFIMPFYTVPAADAEFRGIYRAVDASPVLDDIETTDLVYVRGSGKVYITNSLTVSDKDSRYLWSAVVKISGGFVSTEDILTIHDPSQINYNWNPLTGELTLSGRSTVRNYRDALRSIQYENTNTINPSTITRRVSFQVRDLLQSSNTVTRDIIIQSVNKAPVLSNIETSPVSYCMNSQEVPVTSAITVQDPDNTSLISATVWISAGYASNETLSLKDQSGITSSWDQTTGILSVTGKASLSAYQTAIRSIRYEKNDPGNPADQEISILVYDGVASSNTVSRKIHVNGRVHAVMSGGATFCGDEVIAVPLTIDLYGSKPWTITLTNNRIFENVTDNPFVFNVTQQGTYRIRSISDANCAGDTIGSGTARVRINTLPAASISGSSTICQRDTADLRISLTGTAPWRITWLLNGANPKIVTNITTNPYFLQATEDGTYTLSSMQDAFCTGTVSGSATVNVIEVPDVTISGLASTYNKQSTEWVPIFGTPAGGTFSGPGLIPYENDWFFVPSLPPVGTHNIVYTYQAVPGACYAYDTAVVRVLEAEAIIEFPGGRTRYCRNEDPFTITAVNLTDLIGQFTISGGIGLTDNGDNTATLDPSALQPNEYTVTYTYYDGTNLSFSTDLDIGNAPVTDFMWETECFTPGQSVTFTNISYSTFGSISSYSWKIYTDTGYYTATTRDVTYSFPEPGNHMVELQVQTSYGCANTVTREFGLRPTYSLADGTFQEDFESAPESWLSSTSPSVTVNSWMLGNPSKGFSGASSGDYCWFTYIPQVSSPKEQSWVTSPCFDFTGTNKPMLKMDIWRLFNANRDGANIQATVDSGKTWMLIGELEDGINWFNNYNIHGNPGGSSVGWSNIIDAFWLGARHSLDMLKGEKSVQFRISYGSDGTAQGNNGIAFDNFWIGERDRTVLLEHFTNASDPLSLDADSTLNLMIRDDSLNIIDLQYHTSFPGPDPFNEQEPYIPGARVLYYGLSEVPYAILNGGARTVHRYDYIDLFPDANRMRLESLIPSKFEILINSSFDGNTLNINTEIVAKEDLTARELTVHIVVIERLITGVTGGNGETQFESVVKTMLPDAAGKTQYKAWITGEKGTIDNSWDMAHVYDQDELRVIAFIQDESTHEIYQAAIKVAGIKDEPIGVITRKIDNPFNVFPNPASDRVFIRFDEPASGNVKIEFYSNLGSLVHTARISKGERETEIGTGALPNGLYFVRGITGIRVTGTRKLTIRR